MPDSVFVWVLENFESQEPEDRSSDWSVVRLSARGRNLLVWIDAAALGLFAVAGSTRALAALLSFLAALVLGVVTAVGGGSLRDVFSGRTPKVFERGEPYAVVAALASVVFLVCDKLSGSATLSTFADWAPVSSSVYWRWASTGKRKPPADRKGLSLIVGHKLLATVYRHCLDYNLLRC